MRCRGFTFTELMAVIFVVGLLLALLIPAVQHAREAAWRMQCQSNLRQVGLAMDNYVDAIGVYPDAAVLPGIVPDVPALSDVLAPFSEDNSQMFVCPADSLYYKAAGLSYEYNAKQLAGKTRQQARKNRRGELLPTHTLWVAYDYSSFHGPKGLEGSRNYLYADGHVDAP